MSFPLQNYWNIGRFFRFKQIYPPGFGNLTGQPHLGVDYDLVIGTPIFAPFDCEVVRSVGPEGGITAVVYFETEGKSYVMRLLHLSAVLVTGKSIPAGAKIALTGNTGLTTYRHLHLDLSFAPFDLNNINNFIDPDKFNWDNNQGGGDMTNEEAKLLIYKATTGHEPQGAERDFALGPISPGDLAGLRFRDDVIASIWKGGLSSSCPDSEKSFWATYFREHSDKHISVLGDQWRSDHVDSVINPLKSQLATVKSQLTTANAKIKTLTNQLVDALAGYKTKLLAKLKAFIDAV